MFLFLYMQLVLSKIREVLGGQMQFAVSGGAAGNVEVL